jgi:hypothetical protein
MDERARQLIAIIRALPASLQRPAQPLNVQPPFQGRRTMKQATVPHPAAPLRTAVFLAVVALLAAACGGQGQPRKQPAAGAKPTSTTEAAMELPPGAERMKVAVTAPADGATVTANQLTLKVAVSGYTDTCDLAGKPLLNATSGHYHVLLDKVLVNMYCTPTATVSMQNLKPGRHTLTVVPALNDHAEVEHNAKSITINYRPAHPLAALTDRTFPGKPSITVLSPKAGATVSGPFDVEVKLDNFDASCALFGKPSLAGYGHWHLNIDSSTGPMMGMGTMLGMSCQRVFHATTDGLKPGETHTLIALLADNGHAPLHPAVESRVEVKIG